MNEECFLMKADRQSSRAISGSGSIVLMIMEDCDTDSLSSGKKVRFNAEDEIFVIPNKWDRLSRRGGTARQKTGKETCTNSKAKDAERRGKGKQRSKKVKKITKSTQAKTTATTRALASPSSQVLELESSVLSTEIFKTRGESSKTFSLEKKPKKSEAPEIKLKLSHRNHKELSQDDIVLPRINYNSDLRKTIKHALVRNRPSCEAGSRPHEQSCRDNLDSFSSPRTRSYSDTTSSTNSSNLDDQDDVIFRDEGLLVLPEREPKFSELSRNVESWSPFGQLSPENRKSRHKMPASLVIPNSILY